jgi:hypothetical protein
VWLDAGGITIETVRAWQGERPWSPHPENARMGGDRGEEYR